MSSIAVGAVNGKSASAATGSDWIVREEQRQEHERDDGEEPEEARVLLRLAVARRERPDGREDRAIGQIAEDEVDEREHEDGRLGHDIAHVAECWFARNGIATIAGRHPERHLRQSRRTEPEDLAGHQRQRGTELSTISTTRFSFSSVTDWSR